MDFPAETAMAAARAPFYREPRDRSSVGIGGDGRSHAGATLLGEAVLTDAFDPIYPAQEP